MLTQEFLDRWIKTIVPKELGPDKDPTSNKPLLGIYISSNEDMEGSRNMFKLPIGENQRVFGVLIPMGDLRKIALGNAGNLKNKYIIRIHESQSEASGVFTLAHEIGHLVGIIKKDPDHDADEDAYADSYAFSRIKEVVLDPELRTQIYIRGLAQGDFVEDI